MEIVPQSLSLTALNRILHAVGFTGVLLIIVAAIYACRVVEARVASLQSQQERALRMLSQTRNLCATRKNAIERLRAAERETAELAAQLPATADETGVLHQLSGSAEKAGVGIRDFRLGAIAEYPTHKELELQFRGEGPYMGWCQFLAALQKLPRSYRISQLHITGPTTRGSNCAVDFQLQLGFARKENLARPGGTP